MAANDFAVFAANGTGEVVLPSPDFVTFEREVAQVSPTRKQKYGLFCVARWQWVGQNTLTPTEFAAITAKIGADGAIRFRTSDDGTPSPAMVQCTGLTDRRPTSNFWYDRHYNVTVEFWNVTIL